MVKLISLLVVACQLPTIISAAPIGPQGHGVGHGATPDVPTLEKYSNNEDLQRKRSLEDECLDNTVSPCASDSNTDTSPKSRRSRPGLRELLQQLLKQGKKGWENLKEIINRPPPMKSSADEAQRLRNTAAVDNGTKKLKNCQRHVADLYERMGLNLGLVILEAALKPKLKEKHFENFKKFFPNADFKHDFESQVDKASSTCGMYKAKVFGQEIKHWVNSRKAGKR